MFVSFLQPPNQSTCTAVKSLTCVPLTLSSLGANWPLRRGRDGSSRGHVAPERRVDRIWKLTSLFRRSY